MKKIILFLAIAAFTINAQAQKFYTTSTKHSGNKTSIYISNNKNNQKIYLPTKAVTYLNDNYSGRQTSKLIRVTSAEGTISYQIIVGKTDLVFDADGNFYKSVAI